MSELTLGELKRLKEENEVHDSTQLQPEPNSKQSNHNTGAVVKKNKSKAPVELSNNTAFNPYTKIKFGKNRHGRLLSRDPRFSDFSGKLDINMFKKSYEFLNDMRKEELIKIKEAIKLHEKYGSTNAKTAAALNELSHLNISSLNDAKRALNKYESENVQIERRNELKRLKKELIEEEKAKIISTGKTPYYFPDKKVKKIYKHKKQEEIKEAVSSSAINYGSARAIHKKLASHSRRTLPKERKSNRIPVVRDG